MSFLINGKVNFKLNLCVRETGRFLSTSIEFVYLITNILLKYKQREKETNVMIIIYFVLFGHARICVLLFMSMLACFLATMLAAAANYY